MTFVFAAKKAGMTQFKKVNKDGSASVIPITLLELVPHQIVCVKKESTDGYSAIVFSAGSDDKNASKPVKIAFEKKGFTPRELIFEERLDKNTSIDFSGDLDFSFLKSLEGNVCDVTSYRTKGKGFAGGMKRWNFGGLRASHGVSVSHRSHGSTGNRQDPGRVFKGKKMAGHYGDIRATVQCMQIVFADLENNLVGIKGGVPGSTNSFVFVRSTSKGFSDKSNVNNITVINKNDN